MLCFFFLNLLAQQRSERIKRRETVISSAAVGASVSSSPCLAVVGMESKALSRQALSPRPCLHAFSPNIRVMKTWGVNYSLDVLFSVTVSTQPV